LTAPVEPTVSEAIEAAMHPTDTQHPDYYHRVVDCQWACPAHTDVPEYIRLIAQGRFSDAYMVNRESNVFPGILGRVCDRPCEPACRRGRVEDKPVAICRLKRVAADLRDDIRPRLPRSPAERNGKRVVCIGAGPASLTVANDLVPLGYEVVILEQYGTAGGLMRTNIPSFRLPASVLDEEIGYIVEMGAELRLNTPVRSLAALLDSAEYDAVFVGTGAPKGKELSLPGRNDSDRIHIGISWLESVAFGHTKKIGENVLIIGVGNTAMDCCRTSLRLGAKNVKVMARKPRGFFKASAWELEDAEEESVEMVVNHSPKAFVVEDGKLVGMRFDRIEYEVEGGRIVSERVIEELVLPCDDVILAIGQENAFPWIERDLGIEFDKWDVPAVDPATFQSTRPEVFFGGDAALGPKNIIWAVEQGHQAAISIHKHCMGLPGGRASAAGHAAAKPQDGHEGMVVQERLQPAGAPARAARQPQGTIQAAERRGRTGLRRGARRCRGAALPELRRADGLHRQALHRVRCLHRHLPDGLPDHDRGRSAGGTGAAPQGAAKNTRAGALPVRAPQADRPADGQGRGCLRALRPVRRALPDQCLGHAEVLGAHTAREG